MSELGNTPADKNYKPSGISRAEEAARKIHNRALLEAEKYAASHARSIVEEVAYGRGFKAGFIEGYEQAEKDIIALIESRLSEILGDAQPKPALRMELQELIARIKAGGGRNLSAHIGQDHAPRIARTKSDF